MSCTIKESTRTPCLMSVSIEVDLKFIEPWKAPENWRVWRRQCWHEYVDGRNRRHHGCGHYVMRCGLRVNIVRIFENDCAALAVVIRRRWRWRPSGTPRRWRRPGGAPRR